MLSVVLLGAGGCGRRESVTPPPPPVPPAEREWTADDIAKDPTGYMKWADAKVGRQIADRQDRLSQVGARLAEIGLKQKNFSQNLSDIDNLNRRMTKAIERADDEDRWPLVLGGQSFDRARARALVDQTRRYIDDRTPMATAYDQAVAKLNEAERSLQNDIEQLRRLREKLALDLERIRISQGVEELAALRQTESAISGFSKALTAMAEEATLSTAGLPQGEPPAPVDVDSFLKKR